MTTRSGSRVRLWRRAPTPICGAHRLMELDVESRTGAGYDASAWTSAMATGDRDWENEQNDEWAQRASYLRWRGSASVSDDPTIARNHGLTSRSR
jgi:hypothetical protein